MKKIIIVLIVIFLTTGCFNYRELNDLGIVTAIGISKEEDEFILDVQLVNIIEAGKNGISESPITVITGKGKTIFEAARSLNMKSSKIFFISNLEYVLLDKSVLTSDIEQVLDYLTRDTRLPLNFLVVATTDNKPKDILSALSQFDINSASNLSNILKLSENRYGETYSLTIKDMLDNYLGGMTNIVYPNIALTGDEKELADTDNLKTSDSDNYVYVKDLIYVKDDKVIELNKDEAFGYNFINNNINNGTITCECDGGYFTAETLKSNFGYKDNLKNNEMIINGNIEVEIVSYNCKDKLGNTKVTEKIANQISDEIKKYVENSIENAENNNSDFIGVNSYIYKNNNKYFNSNNKWANEDNNLSFKYNIKTDIVKQGNLRSDI